MDGQKIVQCNDLKFKLLYNREHIEQEITKVATKIDEHFQKILAEDPASKFLILGVLNGAFMFVSEIVQRLVTPVMVDFIKVKSYKGMVSGQLTIESELNFGLYEGTNIVILDDICDSGKTLAQLSTIFKNMGTKSVKVGVLVTRPDKPHQVEPDFSCLTCSAFIIGYGLDYNLQGRQYPEIYQKVDQ